MNKAVFLDRDGVINLERGKYIERLDDFQLLDHALKHIRMLHEAGFIIVVITNQGGIAKGLYTKTDLQVMHDRMLDEVKLAGLQVEVGCISLKLKIINNGVITAEIIELSE